MTGPPRLPNARCRMFLKLRQAIGEMAARAEIADDLGSFMAMMVAIAEPRRFSSPPYGSCARSSSESRRRAASGLSVRASHVRRVVNTMRDCGALLGGPPQQRGLPGPAPAHLRS